MGRISLKAKGLLIIKTCLLLATVVGLSLTSVPFSSGSHSTAVAFVEVDHKGLPVASYETTSTCVATSGCHYHVTITSRRDYNRFLRWCGSDTVTVTDGSDFPFAGVFCIGPGTWFLLAIVVFCDATCTTTVVHGSTVTADIHAHLT